jgi:MFS family permease
MTILPTVQADSRFGEIYNRAFWLAYSANLLLVTANSLTFRFAEFVQFLHGTEVVTGQIVRAGLIGSLLVRLVLGQAIDGLGVRRLWIASSLVFISGCSLFVVIDHLGPLLFVARVLFTSGIASMFACSICHIQNQAPPHRRTEVIGSLGTSGFVGMVTGTQLGDLLFRTVSDHHTLFVMLFAMTAVLGAGYLAIVLYLTRRDGLPHPHAGPPAHRVIFRYWPQPVVLVSLLMGVGFTVTTVFLTRYATEQKLGGIGAFFAGYAVSAFVFRWVSRTWSQTIGRHRMLLIGLAAHTTGYLLLTRVTSQWGFVLPSLCTGFGHALLFPCVVSLGAGAFPPEHRGTGTSITLASIDLGTMISAPILGGVIERQGFDAMFYWTAALMLAGVVIYGALKFHVRDNDAVALVEDETAGEAVPAAELATAEAE